MTDTRRSADSAQGLLALIGITLGAIPLIQVVVTGHTGWLLGWLPGMESSPMIYVLPIAIVLAAVAGIGGLERGKHRSR